MGKKMDLNTSLNAIRRCPLATLDDVKSLLQCVACRVADFDKATPGCDLSAVVASLDEACDDLEAAEQRSVDPAEAAREVEQLRRAA